MTHKERLAAIEADLGKLISDIRSTKVQKHDQAIERGMLVGQTAPESILTVVREDMPD